LLVALVTPSAAQTGTEDPRVGAYTVDAERAAAWDLLRSPIAFEPGTASLTSLSQELAADQALTLAENPSLVATVGVAVGSPAEASAQGSLFRARVATLSSLFASFGTSPQQVRFVPISEPLAPTPFEGEEEDQAAMIAAEGPLQAGVVQVPYAVRTWPRAAVYVLPGGGRTRDAVLCDPPETARRGFAGEDGVFEGFFSRRAVTLLSRHGSQIAVAEHAIGTPPVDEPVDLPPADICD
jgi:hypothetical protein